MVFKRSFLYYSTYSHRDVSKHGAAKLLLGKSDAEYLKRLDCAAHEIVNRERFDMKVAHDLLDNKFTRLRKILNTLAPRLFITTHYRDREAIDKLSDIIEQIVETYPIVQGIYVFGSYGTAMMHDQSDIDVGVLREFTQGVFHLPGSLVEASEGRRVSIFDMRKSYSLRFIEEIITSGELVYAANPDEIEKFSAGVKKEFNARVDLINAKKAISNSGQYDLLSYSE